MINKTFVFLFVSLTIIVQAAIVTPTDDYDTFFTKNNKKYNGTEKEAHRKIYLANKAKIDQLNKNGHKLAANKFFDMNQTELDKFNTYRPQNQIPNTPPKKAKSPLVRAAPVSFDWRALGKVTPVKDQGSCGSCWAFSSTAQYESLLAIQSNTLYDLAEQYAVECETVVSGGCNGGAPAQALILYNSTGIPLETAFPYQPTNDHYYRNLGRPICTQLPRVKLSGTPSYVGFGGAVTADSIIYELTTYGPVTVGVQAGQVSFYGTSNGMISCESSNAIDHAILLVGYNASHWFIKNSWGTWWGDNGFGYINRTADCGILSYVSYFRMPQVTPPPPPTPPTPSNDTSKTTLVITMTDSFGDGWEGSSIGLKQNDSIIADFGLNFTSGSSFGPVEINVTSNLTVDIVVVKLGSYTNEVGFKIAAKNGTVLFTKAAGTAFTSTTLFGRFCPYSCVPPPTTKVYAITLGDTKGDGWNGTQISLKQNGTVKIVLNMTSGASYGPINVTLTRLVKVDIVVTKLGTGTSEVKLNIKTLQGYTVFNRAGGTTFTSGAILGSWTPDATNENPVASPLALPQTPKKKV